MSKTLLIIVVLFVVIVGAVGVFSLVNKSEPVMVNETVDNEMTFVDDEIVGDSYMPFSPEALNSSANTRRVLFFYANWCPTCQPANESFSENMSQIPADVTVIRVNYNDTETDSDEKDLAQKYGITYQHTFVQIDDQGNEVTKWNGGQLDELLSNLQ